MGTKQGRAPFPEGDFNRGSIKSPVFQCGQGEDANVVCGALRRSLSGLWEIYAVLKTLKEGRLSMLCIRMKGMG